MEVITTVKLDSNQVRDALDEYLQKHGYQAKDIQIEVNNVNMQLDKLDVVAVVDKNVVF